MPYGFVVTFALRIRIREWLYLEECNSLLSNISLIVVNLEFSTIMSISQYIFFFYVYFLSSQGELWVVFINFFVQFSKRTVGTDPLMAFDQSNHTIVKGWIDWSTADIQLFTDIGLAVVFIWQPSSSAKRIADSIFVLKHSNIWWEFKSSREERSPDSKFKVCWTPN